ncbi:hypothetical protein EON83_30655 [bacterium]|nr:MAG: hypothetical protein EON83_30655 [bacterium]
MPVAFLPPGASCGVGRGRARARTLKRVDCLLRFIPASEPDFKKLNGSLGFRAVRHDGETQLGLMDGSSPRRRDSIALRRDHRDVMSDGIGVSRGDEIVECLC